MALLAIISVLHIGLSVSGHRIFFVHHQLSVRRNPQLSYDSQQHVKSICLQDGKRAVAGQEITCQQLFEKPPVKSMKRSKRSISIPSDESEAGTDKTVSFEKETFAPPDGEPVTTIGFNMETSENEFPETTIGVETE